MFYCAKNSLCRALRVKGVIPCKRSVVFYACRCSFHVLQLCKCPFCRALPLQKFILSCSTFANFHSVMFCLCTCYSVLVCLCKCSFCLTPSVQILILSCSTFAKVHSVMFYTCKHSFCHILPVHMLFCPGLPVQMFIMSYTICANTHSVVLYQCKDSLYRALLVKEYVLSCHFITTEEEVIAYARIITHSYLRSYTFFILIKFSIVRTIFFYSHKTKNLLIGHEKPSHVAHGIVWGVRTI